MKVGDLVKTNNSDYGCVVSIDTWHDDHGPYEMIEIMLDMETILSLPDDELEVISECG